MKKNGCLFLIFLLPFFGWAQLSKFDLGGTNWQFRKSGDTQWLPAIVPGTVHTDLLANGKIPDPFFADNEKQLQGIESSDWDYETIFTITKKQLQKDHIELEFEGLDTYAKVFLNGTLLFEADNMFRNWKSEVKTKLLPGKNKLTVSFASAVGKGKQLAAELPYVLPGEEKIFTRKAQYQYGWDWGPRFVTAGIWKNVRLNLWNNLRFTDVKCIQKSLSDAKAELQFNATISVTKKGFYSLKVNDTAKTFWLVPGKNTIALNYAIKNPKRWWSNGLGDAFLYDFSIAIGNPEQIFDRTKLSIGLRTIELIQEKDAAGKTFYFKLNGVPVFMKGANYIPPDSFLPRATPETYTDLVKNAVAANMNTLRVWGGGVYADDAFYDACDKNGILVWQDFMFACAMYPGDKKFIENVRQEVIDNAKRLQSHPSVAVWCGNNESDEGWKNWGWQKQYKYSKADSIKIWNDYDRLFHKVIPQILDSIFSDDKRIYWPSSPSIGWGRKESLLQGDSHYWGVWWGMEPFEVYEKKVGRFMSEYGFQSLPNIETLQKMAVPTDWNLDSAALKNHQKHPTGYQTIEAYMAREFKIPTNLADYAYVSQLLQAKGMQAAIEAHRRAMPYCMGSLYWQFNDCWPVTSWSSMDYFGNWKAFHYQVKRSFEPVLVSIANSEAGFSVYVVSDELIAKNAKLDVQLIDFRGKILWQKSREITVEANTSKAYLTIAASELGTFNAKNCVLSARLVQNSQETKNACYYFVPTKELELPNPKITIKKLAENTIEIHSDTFAKAVFLSAKDAFFSDNYFDLLPSETRQIKITSQNKISAEAISVKTVADVK